MQGYKEYKETGLAWLEKIPSHWQILRAKNMYKKENRPPKNDDEVVTCFRDGQVTLRKNRRATGYTEAIQEHGYQRIEVGDLVIHVMDAFAGAIGVSDSSGKCTPVYSVCSAKEDLNNFYYAQILRVMACKGYIQSLYRGIRERSSDFRYEVFAQQLLPVPPREEQDKIVQFLDHKLEKIHKFIANKQKLITLLEEQKQAIISEKVFEFSKKHVKSNRLSLLTSKIGSGKTPRGGSAVYQNEGVLFIRSQNVYPHKVITESAYYISEKIDISMSSTRVFFDDVLLNITGGSIGRSAVFALNIPANVNQHVCIIRTNKEKLLPEFLCILLNSDYGQNIIRNSQNAGNRESLTFVQIGQFEIPTPEISEQLEFIKYTTHKMNKINEIIAKYKKEIDLIQEYKTSLISSVVTGQVDVRNS